MHLVVCRVGGRWFGLHRPVLLSSVQGDHVLLPLDAWLMQWPLLVQIYDLELGRLPHGSSERVVCLLFARGHGLRRRPLPRRILRMLKSVTLLLLSAAQRSASLPRGCPHVSVRPAISAMLDGRLALQVSQADGFLSGAPSTSSAVVASDRLP